MKASFDPNVIEVEPGGYIMSGTELKYTVMFENTGNDTAHNIYVLDTLPDFVDVRSLRIKMATHRMAYSVVNNGYHNVVKFDFPRINLLDSSHHGLCDGALEYTVKVKEALAAGMVINNRAGIYFDVNPVVMTNTVTDIIGFPTGSNEVAGGTRIYPNPVNNELHIDAPASSFETAIVTNMLGQQVGERRVVNGHAVIATSDLVPAMYFITMKGASGAVTRKFEKR